MAATKKSKKSKVPGKDRFRAEVLERLQMIETKVDGTAAGIVRALVDDNRPDATAAAQVAIGQTRSIPFGDLAVGVTYVDEGGTLMVKVGDESACEPHNLDDNEHIPLDAPCYVVANVESVYVSVYVLDAPPTPTLHGPFLNIDFANLFIKNHVPSGQGYYHMTNPQAVTQVK